MKKKLLYIALMVITMTSCLDDLNVEQKSAINSESMWQTESDLKAAMYGSFYSFRNAFKTNLTYWGDFRSGVIGAGLGSFTATAYVNNQLTSSEGKGTSWASLYTCINDCNMIIKYADKVKYTSEDTHNQIKADAFFLRAYCYYTIVRVWGDAPLMLTGVESDKDDIKPARSSADLLYTQIAADIDSAEARMPASVTTRTTGSWAAVKMLKTDYWLWVYKTRNGGTDALTKAGNAVDGVLSNPNYSLLASYADVFSTSKKNNAEIIFTIHMEKTESEGGYPADYLIPTSKYTDADSYRTSNTVKTGSQDQWYSFSSTFQQLLYENANDQRSSVSFMSFTIPETKHTYTWINKFPGEWISNTRYFTSDIPIYRYAEALLFKAEIENARGGDAITPLNKIAKRAYGTDDYYTSLTDKKDIDDAILNERLKEFAGEGKSWWDYIRMGYAFTKITSLIGRQNETNILLWPISSSCFENNPNIRQTVGYN
jgi:hypothetical protein